MAAFDELINNHYYYKVFHSQSRSLADHHLHLQSHTQSYVSLALIHFHSRKKG
jgi:hypothetical protein